MINEYTKGKTLVFAKNLRNIELRREVPKNKPGWYRWWAPKEALEKLLNSQHISNSYLYDLISYLTKKYIDGKDYYYIYVGIAVRESIHDRLHWHVNQKHAKSSVVSGYLSTLRQSISSLVAGNQYNEEATNELIDMLIIEYFPIDFGIKSQEAKEKIESIEKYEIINNVLPLNLRDNKNDIVKDFLKELSKARKNSK